MIRWLDRVLCALFDAADRAAPALRFRHGGDPAPNPEPEPPHERGDADQLATDLSTYGCAFYDMTARRRVDPRDVTPSNDDE